MAAGLGDWFFAHFKREHGKQDKIWAVAASNFVGNIEAEIRLAV
jgi:hypothetical protein